MKMTQNKRKIIISISIALLCTIITCVPIFAYSFNPTQEPEDLGTKINLNTNVASGFYYLKIKLKTGTNKTFASFSIQSVSIQVKTQANNGTYYLQIPNVIVTNGFVRTLYPSYDTNFGYPIIIGNDYYFLVCIADETDNLVYWGQYGSLTTEIDFELYTINNVNNEELELAYLRGFTEGYTAGYNTGYNEGFTEGQDIQQYTNLVGYVQQLIGQFTGNEVAQYITPLAVVLVILFVYFLFIRFLLSMIKAKGVIKTCDIIMIVGCIIILIVMYAPMLNLTIKTENTNNTITQDNAIYEVSTDTTIKNYKRDIYYYDDKGNIIGDIYNGITKQNNIWTEYIETGKIIHRPDGDIVEIIEEETIEKQNDYNRE